MSKLIEAVSLTKTYTKGKTSVPVFTDLSFGMEDGEFVALMGPSGSGKSTLLNLLAGFDRPSSGQLRLAGTDITTLSEADLGAFRLRNIGFVFQAYNLVSSLTAAENVEVPLRNLGIDRATRKRNVGTALELVGLADRATHYPHELSGGEEQRVAVARALISDPKIILADEPTGNLDETAAKQILEMLKKLNEQQGKSIMLVTHDPFAASYAQRKMMMRKGHLMTGPAPAEGAVAG